MKFHSDIPYGYQVMGHTRVVWTKEINQREVIQKLRKGEQSFFYATRRLDLIHITLMFSQNIPYTVTGAHKKSLRQRIKGKQLRKYERERIFLHMARHRHLIYIAMKFHLDIPYGYRIMARQRVV